MNHIDVFVVTLGCAKNRVDTELMLGKLKEKGVYIAGEPEDSDVIIVNTCGFIQDAKEESISAVFEAVSLKEKENPKGIVVTGCLPERFKQQLAEELNEADVYMGVNDYHDIYDAVLNAYNGVKKNYFSERYPVYDYQKRVLTTPQHMAYVRIAEGCDNRCSYCVIPDIRGRYRSRDMEDILGEITGLVGGGVKEIVLIAQDTTRYGTDNYRKPMLHRLLKKAAKIQGVRWLRVLYCYPENITDDLLDVMGAYDNIIKYVDMPVQHLDDTILKKMRRRYTYEQIRELVRRIRSRGEFILRTSLITGFPGETKAAHERLLSAVRELKFDRLGVFKYYREEGTKAATFLGQVKEEIKVKRRNEIMRVQSGISYKSNRRFVGQTLSVLVEEKTEEADMYAGRAYIHAPEIDGNVFVRTKKDLTPGAFHDVVITEAYDYDLMGEI